jgi:hypothetical protein
MQETILEDEITKKKKLRKGKTKYQVSPSEPCKPELNSKTRNPLNS